MSRPESGQNFREIMNGGSYKRVCCDLNHSDLAAAIQSLHSGAKHFGNSICAKICVDSGGARNSMRSKGFPFGDGSCLWLCESDAEFACEVRIANPRKFGSLKRRSYRANKFARFK